VQSLGSDPGAVVIFSVMCREKQKARVPQVRRCYVPKHGVRCRSCTSQPAIPDVVTRDGPALYNRRDR
jgi:hypothetical protein